MAMSKESLGKEFLSQFKSKGDVNLRLFYFR